MLPSRSNEPSLPRATAPAIGRRAGATALTLAVLAAMVAVAPGARAESPGREGPPAAPSPEAPALPGGAGELAPEAPDGPAPTDGDVSVSAVVITEAGADIVTREAEPQDVGAVITDLRNDPGVVSVSVDTPVSIDEVPDDPWRGQQWGLDDLRMDELPAGTPDGSAVKVAVLDTGVLATHEDLAGRVRCDLGADFTTSAQSSTGNGCIDPNGHGTHVAGTVSAISDNGIGVTGVSAAEIIPVRVLGNDGWGSSAGINAGILWAVDHGASVINMSLGGDGPDSFAAAVKYATDRGVVVVAAAGNNRETGNAAHYPGATPGVFSVASMNWNGVSSWFSHIAPTNLISAPGSSVLSTTNDGDYGYKSGTSMATPHAAGVLARYRQAHPLATVAQIRTAVQATANDLEVPGRDDNTGYGMIDAYQLLTGQEATPPLITAPGEPTKFEVTPGNGSLSLTWDAPSFTGGVPVEGYGLAVFHGIPGEESFLDSYGFAASQRSFTLTGLTNGVGYSLQLWAYNSAWDGNAAYTPVPVAPQAGALPGASAVTSTVPGNAAVTVSWKPAADGGSPITGYLVRTYRGATLLGTTSAAATATTLKVTGLTNGTAYAFTVAAVNANGTAPYSALSAAVVPRTVPGAPAIGAPSAANASAVVRWAAPAGHGGSPITGYTVRAFRGTTLVKTVTATASARSLTVTGLPNGVAHTFTVTASNAAGAGSPSARSASVVPKTRPGAPKVDVPTVGKAAATVRWTAPADGGSPITGYTVRAYRGSAVVKTVAVGAGARSVTVTGLAGGAGHTFTVTAINSVGAGTASAKTPTVVPRS